MAQSINNNNKREQLIATLSGYMPEAQAKKLAHKYDKRLSMEQVGTDSEFAHIMNVGAANMYDTFTEHGCLDNCPDGWPTPKPGDWGVFVDYFKWKRSSSGEWVEDFRDDGYMDGESLGSLAAKYNINL